MTHLNESLIQVSRFQHNFLKSQLLQPNFNIKDRLDFKALAGKINIKKKKTNVEIQIIHNVT